MLPETPQTPLHRDFHFYQVRHLPQVFQEGPLVHVLLSDPWVQVHQARQEVL